MIFEDKLNIVIAGEAGQGIDSAGKILSKILHLKNYHTFFAPEYMSRIKGGCNSSLVKITKNPEPFFVKKIDILLTISPCAVEHLKDRTDDETITIQEGTSNFYVIGYVFGLFKFEFGDILNLIEAEFGAILDKRDNRTQLESGFNAGLQNNEIQIKIPVDEQLSAEQLISGNEAFGKGCIKGGCNFAAFYPMSPSTFLSQFLCENSEEFNIITQQAEDEICAINMALGAVYAGARTIVPTAGGGFSLMCEGVSLAGIIESPIVINIAQRPGPATGLPTRDAQEDLNLALYSGHGEFPRIIFSPSTIENSFEIGRMVFDLSEKFQVPVFVLTQQSFLESDFAAKQFADNFEIQSYIVKSDNNYKRYDLSSGPISPRSIPNYGEGLVCVDSDEHNEIGQITESFQMRKSMVDKRLKKLDLIREELEGNVIGFDFTGAENYENLIISWGGNFYNLKTAIEKINEKNGVKFALLHIAQLYPLQKRVLDYIKSAKKLIIVEQNATGQLANLLVKEFFEEYSLLKFDHKFLKYDGEPISHEEITEFLNALAVCEGTCDEQAPQPFDGDAGWRGNSAEPPTGAKNEF